MNLTKKDGGENALENVVKLENFKLLSQLLQVSRFWLYVWLTYWVSVCIVNLQEQNKANANKINLSTVMKIAASEFHKTHQWWSYIESESDLLCNFIATIPEAFLLFWAKHRAN